MKSKWILIFFSLILVGGLIYGINFWFVLGKSQGYAPEQVIPFSHKLHAGQYQIPCMYCHVNADRSKHATVPSMNICMNCHSQVKASDKPEDKNNYSPYLKKLRDFYKEGKPLLWTKVHDLPDFVYFSHKRHVLKGVDCTACHGDVRQMDRVEQVMSLDMGFCLDCHRKPESNAPTDCYTCHH